MINIIGPGIFNIIPVSQWSICDTHNCAQLANAKIGKGQHLGFKVLPWTSLIDATERQVLGSGIPL